MMTDEALWEERSKIIDLLLLFLRFENNAINIPLKEITFEEWEGIVQESIKQRIGGLLYHRLETYPTEAGIPLWVLKELRQHYLDTALSNMQLYGELYKVLKVLQDADIPVIVLKGAYLAQGVYSNVALRSLGDLDILVKKGDVSSAARKLQQVGYHMCDEGVDWAVHLENFHHFLFLSPSSNAQIELHWNLRPSFLPFQLNMDELWGRSQPTVLAGVETLVLCPEDLLLHICIHMFIHHSLHYYAPRYLLDISEILRHFRGQINWRSVQKLSQDLNAGNCVYLSMRLAQELLDAPVSNEVLDNLAPQAYDPRYFQWTKERLFTQMDSAEDEQRPYLSGRFANVYASQGLFSKLSALWLACFPARETMAQLYMLPADSRQIYFYYLKRLFDLSNKFSSVAWDLIKGDPKTVAWIDWEGQRSALMDWLVPSQTSSLR